MILRTIAWSNLSETLISSQLFQVLPSQLAVHVFITLGLKKQEHILRPFHRPFIYKYFSSTNNNTKSHKYFSYRNLKRFDHNKLVQTLEKPDWT